MTTNELKSRTQMLIWSAKEIQHAIVICREKGYNVKIDNGVVEIHDKNRAILITGPFNGPKGCQRLWIDTLYF